MDTSPSSSQAMAEGLASLALGAGSQGAGKKVPSESRISASPERPKTHQMLCSVPECSTAKQVGQGRVENWAYVNFSCLRFKETNKFVFELRDTCLAIGMEFENLDPTVNLHIDNPVPSVTYLHGLIEDEAVKKDISLLIVILPDFRSSDVEVLERCDDVGVPYQTFLPEKATTSSKEHLNREAREINRKILLYYEVVNFFKNMEERDQSTEQMGDDCISMELGDKIRKDGDSNKLCSPHKESQDSDSSESSDEDMGEFDDSPGVLDEETGEHGDSPGVLDEEMGEHGDSPGVLDEEMGEHGDSPGVLDEEMGEHGGSIIGNDTNVDSDSSDFEDDESDFIKDECVYETEDLEDSEDSCSDDEMRDDCGTEGRENYIMSACSTDILPPFTAFLCPYECDSLLKAGWGTKVPYKKPSSISWDDYSKLFDTNGYYKLRGKPEKDKTSAEESFVEHMANENSNTAADQVTSEKFLGYAKKPWLMGVRSTKRDYASYDNLKIHRGVVVDWAFVNFSQLGDRRLYRFCCKLASACHSIRMSFDSEPLETFHEKSADPDIENTFVNIFENLSKQFAYFKMAGETKGLVLVILPEARTLDAKIRRVCDNHGVLYHCLLPSDISLQDDASMNKLACQIKSKVVERDTFIPFVLEGPTLILGADTSCNNVASVVAPVKWQKFINYKALYGSNNGAEIQDLFNEDGGMIGDLLFPFRKKIERGCRIIFFRHGVIEDHIDNICRQEVHALKLACGQLEIGCKPSVTFVVVGGNKEESPNGGKHDFVCHHGFVKGISTARYRVLLDENNLTFADVESIIIKLCLLRDHVDFPQIHMVPPAYAALESSLADTDELSLDD